MIHLIWRKIKKSILKFLFWFLFFEKKKKKSKTQSTQKFLFCFLFFETKKKGTNQSRNFYFLFSLKRGDRERNKKKETKEKKKKKETKKKRKRKGKRNEKKMTSEIVIVSGVSGAGKTFTGDYLETCHNFFHIDGDYYFHQNDDRSKEIVKNLKKAFYEFWFHEKIAPVEIWHPYYDAMKELVDKAQEEHPDKKVVLSHSVYRVETREYLQKLFPGHKFVLLKIEGEELFTRHRVRFEKFAEAQDTSPEELWKTIHKQDYTNENFRTKTAEILQGLQGIKEEEKERAREIEVKGDIFEQLKIFLELGETPSPIPVEMIAEKNYERFKTSKACEH